MATILLIDDTHEVHEFVKRALGEEHHILAIDDWNQAKDHIFKHDVDLILMDVQMPGIFKGDKLTQFFKNVLSNKPLKIVLFSTLDEEDLRERAEQSGADGYIHKTFNDKLLRLQVRKYLPKGQI